MKSNFLLDNTLMIGAQMWQPLFAPITIMIFSFLVTINEIEMRKIDVDSLEQVDALDYQVNFTFTFVLVSTGILLGVTTLLKKITNRERPEPCAERKYDFRSVETNKSFPSGDTAQMAHLLILMFLNFKHARFILGGPIGMG